MNDRVQLMQITQYNSNKYLQNAISDPLVNIFRQLRDLDAEEGDYIRIIEKETFFQPIYKITYLQQRKAKQEQPIRKSLFRDNSNDIRINQQRLLTENQEKIRLSFGSQIYLKYNNLLHAKIALIKPKFPNLFIQLKIKGKGLIHCIDGKVIINNFQKTESIWMCISSIVQQSTLIQQQESKSQVIFCNFVQNQYLYIDSNGIMTVCPEERATRFNLKQIGSSDSYVLEGRNVLSQMIRNKSKEQIKRIIDRSIDRNEGSKTSLQIQLEIMPVEDTMITIHLELNYSKKALERQPSLKLIKLILNELIYYDILDFLRDDSILSEHIQELLIEYHILKLIEKHLEKYFEYKCHTEAPIMVLPNRISMERNSSKRQRNSSKEGYDEYAVQQILKIIGLLCRQNIQISKIFIQLLDQLIMKELYHFAELLMQNNQYFLSQFHKANWYSHLYRIICRSSKHDVCRVANFLNFFCKSQKELSLNDSAIEYRSKPSTSNQYLLYHSVRTGDTFARIFRYELYIEGIYVFVHDTKSGKDIQFNTFVEGSASESSNPIKDRSSIKIQLQQSVPQQSLQRQQQVQLLLSQLKFLRALTYNYNPNIILNIWTVVYGLAPYCYKENFPQIQNYQIKNTIFQLIVELEPFHRDAKLLSTFLISCSLVDGDNFGRNSLNQEQSKIGVSNFIKNNKKKTQTSRKILKQMGNHFLKKGKGWSESIRKKTLQIAEICNNRQEHLSSWLEIMVQALTMRLFKVKQKKQGQLLGYIKKLFQTIEDKKGVIQNEGNMMNEFMELLLEIVKNHSKYDKYLQQIKAKRYYDGKSNQINKVISNLQGKKEVSFNRNQKGLTKIELIDLVHRGLSQQEANIRESTRKQIDIINNEQFERIKLTSLRLIQLMILNVNEEMIDEAVDTLTYLIKNPSTISSLSSFNLLDMLPKYPYEHLMKRIVLEQWYLSSNCHQLNELLEILRLIYTKHMIYRRNVNNVLLIDNQLTFKAFQAIVSPVKFLKRVASHCESWLRPSLLDKYPDIYMGVDKNLQAIVDCLQKLSDKKLQAQIANLIENIDLVDVLSRYLEYISAYYLQQQTETTLQKSRLFHMKSQINFVELKLSPLAEKIIKILQIYTKGSGIQRTKFVLFTFGEILSSVHGFSIILIQIMRENIDSSQQNLLQLLQSISPSIIYNFSLNFKKTWKFFQFYLYLQGQDLLREVNSLYRNALCKFDEIQQQKFVITFLNSCVGKHSTEIIMKSQLMEDKYDFGHQIVIMKIVLKLLYSNFLVDFVYWFKDKVFWHLIQSLTKNNSQNYYMLELTNEQIKRRQLVAQLAFYFKSMATPQTSSHLKQKEEHDEEFNHLVIDFIVEEHQLSKLYIDLEKSNHQNIRKISDSAYIEYLQYLVCDVTILAYSVNFLTVAEVFKDFSQYFLKLKDIYKRRVSYKSNDDTFSYFINAERIFLRDPNFKLEGKLRTIKFDRLNNGSASDSRSEAKVQIKPLRKWAKAVGELNKEKFLNKNPEFIEDMLSYEQIYELKNESEEMNLVINHHDIFLKLLEVSLNMKRLKLSVQNQIFVLENLLLVSKARHKKKKELDEGLMNYGIRVLEMLLEQQGVEPNFDREASIQSYQKWKSNTYCLALMLRIIQYSRCLQMQRIWRQYLHHLLSFLNQSIANYQSDITFMQLYLSTIHSHQEMQQFDLVIPFETIISIFTKQITVVNMSEDSQMAFGGSVLRAYLSFNQTLEYDFRRYTSSELMKIIDSIDKAILTRIYNELNEDLYYRCLLTIKK